MSVTRSVKLGAAVAVLATTAGLVAAPSALADPSPYRYSGYSGGTLVRAAGNSITSDLTAESSLTGNTVPASTSNSIAKANVPGFVGTGLIRSNVYAQAITDGTKQVAHVRTAGVNLLGGLIRAKAVDTTATARKTSTSSNGTGNTRFVNLRISGLTLPVTIPQNYTLTIPGIAKVVLNAASGPAQAANANGAAYAIGVTLLTARGLAPVGSSIYVNLASAQLTDPVPAPKTSTGGYAFGTHVAADAGSILSLDTGTTAPTTIPAAGTGGATLQNSTVAIQVPEVVQTGTIATTGTADISDGGNTAYSSTTSSVQDLNLFGGLIRADAVSVAARVDKSGSTYTPSRSMNLVHLVIEGNTIPVDVSPNTEIDIAGLGKVIVNEQASLSYATLIRGLHITLDTARAGLPVGTNIEVAVASAWVLH